MFSAGVGVNVSELAPLEYRQAIDAAMAVLTQPDRAGALICNNVSQLDAEIRQRFQVDGREQAKSALWVDPLNDTWPVQLKTLAHHLDVHASLVIVLSLPLARIVPERRRWAGRPAGYHPISVLKIYLALRKYGFSVREAYGFHSVKSIVFQQLSQALARAGRPDLGDRLHFAGRLRYQSKGLSAAFCTVCVIVLGRTSEKLKA